MADPIKAIETRYKGYRFRSRLEARWAVFFDALGLDWEYEPEGYELSGGKRYLPDFRLSFGDGNPIWFEVKGDVPTEQEIQTCARFADESNRWVMLASGTMDVPQYSSGHLTGAMIYGFSPRSSWERMPKDPEERKALRIFASLHLFGFYEERAGAIQIDHLYVQDVDFTDSYDHRPIVKAHLWGAYEGINYGNGRKYRSPRLVAAYAAARSARFEFGENGAG